MRCNAEGVVREIEPHLNSKEGDTMMDNRTSQICDNCNSHIAAYRQKGRIIFECSYCGTIPEDVHPIDLIEEDED